MSKEKRRKILLELSIDVLVDLILDGDKETEKLQKENKILNNKLKMIKDNIDTITREEILDIIDNYTGFFGKEGDK